MQQHKEAPHPPTPAEEAEYIRRRQDEAYWIERRDRILDLETRWAFIRSRPPDREAPDRQCQYVAEGQPCTFQRTVGASQFAPFPLYCRFHLLTAFAADLTLLLGEDPEKISEHYSIGCLRLLVEERLQGGSRADEAQGGLRTICKALLREE